MEDSDNDDGHHYHFYNFKIIMIEFYNIIVVNYTNNKIYKEIFP